MQGYATMGEPKTFASLTSGLLARKGDARPAMRRQYIGGSSGNLAVSHEDLGWNDMGEEAGYHIAPQPHAGLSPMPTSHSQTPIAVVTDAEPVAPVEPPHVVEQQKMLAEKVTNGKVETTPSVKRAKTSGKPAAMRQRKEKAAFTLRLDPDRHLKLRLACAVANRSAQQLVVEALDSLLDQLPQIEQMAGHVPNRRAAGQA